MPHIRFSVQGHPKPGESFAAFARNVEALGYDTLLVPDHPGSTAAPFVALASVASATTTLRLGTCVANAGAWEPLALASELATLDVVSDGRAVFGVGAGHTPAEWTMVGRSYPDPATRVAEMVEVVDATRRLLAGETVTVHTARVQLDGATLGWPQPARSSIPLFVGGNGGRLLAYGGAVADVVEVTGLGRTLEDGHRHEVAWSGAAIDDRVARVRRGAAGRDVGLSALVQVVELTDDRVVAAERLCAGPLAPVDPTDVLSCPFALLGTLTEIGEQIARAHERWGFDRYTVRGDAIEALAPLVEHLAA